MRLRIEPLTPAHAALFFADLCDPRLYRYVPDEPPRSRAALAAVYRRWARGAPADRNETWRNWAVLDPHDGRPIGTLQATIYPDLRATIAYLVVTRRWHEGLGREAVRWLVEHLRGSGARAIEARIDPRNSPSIRLVEALGFRYERTTDGDSIYRSR